jgi:hypothetical protein
MNLAELAVKAAACVEYREARKLLREYPGSVCEPEEEYPEGSVFSGCEAADYVVGPKGVAGSLLLTNYMVGISHRDRRLLRYTGELGSHNYTGYSLGGQYPKMEVLADWSYSF